MRQDTEENEKLYGKGVTNKQILQGEVDSPKAGWPLVATLNRYSEISSNRASPEPSRGSNRVMMAELHFASGQSEVTPELASLLATAKTTLEENPEWKIHVEGYTDNVGSKSSNEELSRRRADSVSNWPIGWLSTASTGVDLQQKAMARRIRPPAIPLRMAEAKTVASNWSECRERRNKLSYNFVNAIESSGARDGLLRAPEFFSPAMVRMFSVHPTSVYRTSP